MQHNNRIVHTVCPVRLPPPAEDEEHSEELPCKATAAAATRVAVLRPSAGCGAHEDPKIAVKVFTNDKLTGKTS